MSKTQRSVKRTQRCVKIKAKGCSRVIAIKGLGSNNTFTNCRIELGNYSKVVEAQKEKRDTGNVWKKIAGIVVTMIVGIIHTLGHTLR